ncbi:hypothetical protein H072_8717 [Dactylellina haptotyla CBS 200.50]|uniref:Uncharacterized protein n=1 Tax=Dactylellina haptotyla (strain CBS 200.50) TaxID=1284197 RepID=S8A8Z7_DACHA|nr:hypothetical protein H072_8717 [Dactylellina haptotyla CBS 200.50]
MKFSAGLLLLAVSVVSVAAAPSPTHTTSAKAAGATVKHEKGDKAAAKPAKDAKPAAVAAPSGPTQQWFGEAPFCKGNKCPDGWTRVRENATADKCDNDKMTCVGVSSNACWFGWKKVLCEHK